MPAPTVREALAEAGVEPRRRLGQHFLLDLNLCRKIARLSGAGPDMTVLEVGPGPGGLTQGLLETGTKVIAVEKDERFVPLLSRLAERWPGQLTILNADALELDERPLASLGPHLRIASNLPYNVGSALLVKWLSGTLRPGSMTLMFQKEVADRIVAAAGGPAYGRLSVLAQAITTPQIVMELPARAFSPPPKVDSAVVTFSPRDPRPSKAVLQALEEVTRAAFGQRRKMLRSSLRTLGGEALCDHVGLDGRWRAQNVDVTTYIGLASALMAIRSSTAPAV